MYRIQSIARRWDDAIPEMLRPCEMLLCALMGVRSSKRQRLHHEASAYPFHMTHAMTVSDAMPLRVDAQILL